MRGSHAFSVAALVLLAACEQPAPPSSPPWAEVEPGEESPGGTATVRESGPSAFSRPAVSLSAEQLSAFGAGEALFEADWFAAPHPRSDRDGLGPLFNSVSCEACHFQNGRGAPPSGLNQPTLSLLVRLRVPGTGEHGSPRPDPVYGDQLQTRAMAGVAAEGRVTLTWEEQRGSFADGEPWVLLKPSYQFSQLAYGPLDPQLRLSPRVAQPLVGLGLLAAVPEAQILEWADPEDADGDGLSGRPNRVWSVRSGREELGRFGWKANQPDLEQQNAAAFLGDLGITSPLFPAESCTPSQADCLNAPSGGAPELDQGKLDALTLYTAALAVPARRGHDTPQVLQGKAVFHRVGCARCHRPTLVTGEVEGLPQLSGQLLWPYTDLLLHDMGEPLADGAEDFLASGQEWRTPPLWGIGLTSTVSGHTRFLHDGRARSLLEAILWHGGEARASRDSVLQLSREEREALIAFLESL